MEEVAKLGEALAGFLLRGSQTGVINEGPEDVVGVACDGDEGGGVFEGLEGCAAF